MIIFDDVDSLIFQDISLLVLLDLLLCIIVLKVAKCFNHGYAYIYV